MNISNDRARLDAEFTLDHVPGIAETFQRRTRAADAALEQFEVRRDIPYGSNPHETLDLFPAAGIDGPAPVQVFIHGGFWSSLAARDFSFVAGGFVPHGAATAVIDYPLIPKVRLADIVASCLRVIGFLRREGAGLGLDPERIFISGNSAGGHLVAETMSRARLREAGLPDDAIKGGTPISGLYELAPVAASFRNDLLQFTEAEMAAFSPLRRPSDISAPLVVAVGGEETREFLDQSARFAEHAAAGGAPVELMVVPDTNHITVILDAFAEPASPLNRAVRRQMGLELA